MATLEELLAAMAAIEPLVAPLAPVTGIDVGVRDEEVPNAEDLAIRVFVSSLGEAPGVEALVAATAAAFGVPLVVLRRSFSPTSLPDTSIHRPVEGGVSVSAARFLGSPSGIPVGTLGAIARTTRTPTPLIVGLSNYHVLCHDANRQFGDEIIQPEPLPLLGRVPNDHLGQLVSWAFPEMVYAGTTDAAICTIEPPFLPIIADLGPTGGTTTPKIAMLVTKRGRTTGQTFGFISGIGGTYWPDYPTLPPVTSTISGSQTTLREMRDQIQVHIDFPQSIVFLESGDSGSVLLESGTNRIVGLLFASGVDEPGEPIKYALANRISTVEADLGITLTL
ncbi:hypothetical protein [Micropruina sp.]|uniref:hypothetical protein n=1 Tax=Micropruina sp. TaxID=2737536 RepID=UPI0039E5D725